LEWSTVSPVPFYNFATIDEVSTRDTYWAEKQRKNMHHEETNKHYETIVLPKNTPFGMYIGLFAVLFGFAAIWHIIWLASFSFVVLIALVITRSTDEDTEYSISPAELKILDKKYEMERS